MYLQVQKFEQGRHPIRRLNERSPDSNEDYRINGDYIEDSSEESRRKPSVKKVVQHSIENHEVKHQSSSNVIDKIFSKDYSKLFQNDSSDGPKQNHDVGVPRSEINELLPIQNHQNDSRFIDRNSDSESESTGTISSKKDTGRVIEQNENILYSDSGRNLQKIFATDNSEFSIYNAGGDSDSVSNQEIDLPTRNVDDIKNKQEVSYQSTFEEELTNNTQEVDNEGKYAADNKAKDYYDDYSNVVYDANDDHFDSKGYGIDSPVNSYDDYYENNEHLVAYDEQDTVYSNQIENYDVYNDYDYNESIDYMMNYDEQNKEYISNQVENYDVYDDFDYNEHNEYLLDYDEQNNQIENYDVYDDFDYNDYNEYLLNYDEQNDRIQNYDVYEDFDYDNKNRHLIYYDEYNNQIEHYDASDDFDYNKENNEYLVNYDEQESNSYDSSVYTLNNNDEPTKKKKAVSVQQVKIQL